MSNELVPFVEIRSLAKSVFASGLFPGVRNESQAYTLMMLAHAEGTHPMQAMLRYDIIDGKPAKKTSAMLADFQAAGGKIKWLARSDEACEAEFSSPHLIEPIKVRWDMKMAKAAGLAGKKNWSTYPRHMLTARVVSEGVNLAMASVRSLYTPEEVSDFDPAGKGYAPPANAIDAEVVERPAATLAIVSDPETGEILSPADEVDSPNTSEQQGADDVQVWRRVRDGKNHTWVEAGFEPKLTPGQNDKIHVLYTKGQFTEAYRRDRLEVLFNKRSTALLSKREAAELITKMEAKINAGKQAMESVAEFIEREPGED